jgi:hypothetical protein
MLTMTDNEYIARELNEAAPTEPDEKIRVKALTEGGESKWLRIPADRWPAVVAAASTPSPTSRRCRHCADELHDTPLPVDITEHSGFCGANPTSNHHEPEESTP